jgi:hypothetical protein
MALSLAWAIKNYRDTSTKATATPVKAILPTKETNNQAIQETNKSAAGETPRHRPHPPIGTNKSVATTLPFVIGTDEFGMISARIPYEELSNKSLHQDSIRATYLDLAEFTWIPSRMDANHVPIAISPGDGRIFVIKALRYYILRSLFEMQRSNTSYSYATGKGATSEASDAILVPEATTYSQPELEKVLAQSEFGIDRTQRHFYWETYKFDFLVPAGSTLSMGDYWILISAKDRFSLRIEVASDGINIGVWPPDFVPVSLSMYTKATSYSFMFKVTTTFEWNGEYRDVDPYRDWAAAVASRLESRLKPPSLR